VGKKKDSRTGSRAQGGGVWDDKRVPYRKILSSSVGKEKKNHGKRGRGQGRARTRFWNNQLGKALVYPRGRKKNSPEKTEEGMGSYFGGGIVLNQSETLIIAGGGEGRGRVIQKVQAEAFKTKSLSASSKPFMLWYWGQGRG